jgi:hypothetical protein
MFGFLPYDLPHAGLSAEVAVLAVRYCSRGGGLMMLGGVIALVSPAMLVTPPLRERLNSVSFPTY